MTDERAKESNFVSNGIDIVTHFCGFIVELHCQLSNIDRKSETRGSGQGNRPLVICAINT